MKYVDLFIKRCGYEPDLKNPEKLNEHLLLWKNQEPDPFITSITDKCYAKKHIKGKSEAVPIPSLFEGQPEDYKPKFPFIAKPNNKSNRTFYVKNKSDWERFKRMYNSEKNKKYGYAKGEWNYWDIDTQFLAEPVIEDFQEYKLMCFNGELKVIQVLSKRDGFEKAKFNAAESLGVSYFWDNGDFINVRNAKRPQGPKEFDFPVDRLKNIAKTLTGDIPFVRLDLLINSKVYFGEYSFCIGGGHTVYDPPEFDRILGDFYEN